MHEDVGQDGQEATGRNQPDRGDSDLADVIEFPDPHGRPVKTSGRRNASGLRDAIGDVLRDERLEQQRTLVDVATEAAVSVPYLSEIERGRKEVSSEVLDAVLGALDLELADALERVVHHLRGVPAQPGPTLQLSAA